MLSSSLIVLVLLEFAAPVVFAFPAETDGQNVKVITVDDISPYKDLSEGDKLIQLVPSAHAVIDYNLPQDQVLKQYSWGTRHKDAVLVYYSVGSDYYQSKAKLQKRFEYRRREHEVGAIIDYVECNLVQNSNEGRAEIVLGGIGYRNFDFIVEANNTMELSYSTRIYGYL